MLYTTALEDYLHPVSYTALSILLGFTREFLTRGPFNPDHSMIKTFCGSGFLSIWGTAWEQTMHVLPNSYLVFSQPKLLSQAPWPDFGTCTIH